MKFSERSIKRFFIFSLLANFLFIFLFGFLLYRHYYLNPKNHAILLKNNRKATLLHQPNYYVQKSIFESLPDTQDEIIFLGDSITDFGRWSEIFADIRIKNRGICADRTDGILERLNEIVSSSPAKIFIMVGINDLRDQVNMAEIVSNYTRILNYIRDKSPHTRIYVQSVLPVEGNIADGARIPKNDDVVELNAHLKELCSPGRAVYIDLFPLFVNEKNQLKEEYTVDGLHINGQGYLIWKAALEKFVNN